MSAKHTPGPWAYYGGERWVGSATEKSLLYCADVHADAPGYRGNVCDIQSADHISGITRAEAAANARLIAAAPDLLEALYAVLDDVEDLDMYPSNAVGREAGAFDLVVAAIAKATGEAA
jgi:hypothetical protein